MNPPSIVLLALLPLSMAAAEPSLLAFPDKNIGLPPLSLAEAAKLRPFDVLKDASSWSFEQSPSARIVRKLVSNMPVVVPSDHLDSKMIVKPDASTDFKLIVKAPDVESSK